MSREAAPDFLRTVLDTVLAGIAVLRGPDFVFELVNPAYQAIVPHRPFVGRSLADAWPDLVADVLPLLQRVVETGEPFHADDMRFLIERDTPGVLEESYFSFTYQPLPPNQAGEPGVLATVIETTSRVRAAERLRHSEMRFRALIEKSTDLVHVIDAEGRFQLVSPNLSDALGWTAADLLGRMAIEFVHPDDRPAAEETFRALLLTEAATRRALVRYRHKDGSWRQVEARARNLLGDPAVRGVVVNSRDITEQRQLEEQFWRAQKLESIGNLAGRIAHDFNNLLTVILSGVEELRSHHSGSPLASSIVEDLADAGARARDLTRQLLTFARRQAVTLTTLDLNVAVQEAERMLRRLLGTSVQLVTILAPERCPIRSDRGQLEQVVLNLAVNANDAMPLGGTLTIETAEVSFGEEEAAGLPEARAGRWARLSVRDTGTGMSPEVQARIFDPFFTTKPAGKGTGLGLATVYGIVKQSGGFLRVSSELGQGTTFDIYFPRATTAEAEPTRTPPPSTFRGTETVLVVEDDPRVRAVALRSLQGAGYRVLLAGDAEEALGIAERRQERLDLLITDMVMPGPSGHLVAEALRAIHGGLRVLYVSGYGPVAVSEEQGAAFLAKPFTPSSLLERVRAVLDAP